MNNYDNDSHPYDENDCVKEKKSDDASSIIFILGLISVVSMISVFSGFYPLIGLVLAIIALIKGSAIRHKSKIAFTGWILSIIGVCLFAIRVILVIVFIFPCFWPLM